MTSDSDPAKTNIGVIAGDACLFTGAAFCLLAVVGGPLAVVIGPAAAWLLHGRRLDRAAVVSGIMGLVVGLLIVGAFLVLAPLILGDIGPVGGWEFAVPATLLALVGAAFLILVVALVVDSLRDLRPAQRQHTRLDIARLVSAAIVILFGGVVGAVQTAYPRTEIGDAGVFALAAAAVGGLAMLAAQVVYARWGGRIGR